MIDHQREFLNILEETGVEYTAAEINGEDHITLEVGNAGVIGYLGFNAIFKFNRNSGRLVGVEIWE